VNPERFKNNNGNNKYKKKCGNENKMQQELEEIIHLFAGLSMLN
jgi:hypothetical protein